MVTTATILFGGILLMIRSTEEAVTMFYSVEVAGNLSDYSLDKSSSYSGGSALDTGIYYQNDLIAVVQDKTNLGI
jgi:hypothetical protein